MRQWWPVIPHAESIRRRSCTILLQTWTVPEHEPGDPPPGPNDPPPGTHLFTIAQHYFSIPLRKEQLRWWYIREPFEIVCCPHNPNADPFEVEEVVIEVPTLAQEVAGHWVDVPGFVWPQANQNAAQTNNDQEPIEHPTGQRHREEGVWWNRPENRQQAGDQISRHMQRAGEQSSRQQAGGQLSRQRYRPRPAPTRANTHGNMYVPGDPRVQATGSTHPQQGYSQPAYPLPTQQTTNRRLQGGERESISDAGTGVSSNRGSDRSDLPPQ